MDRDDIFSVLDQPSVHEVVFHTRPAYGHAEDDVRNVLFAVESDVKIGCRFYSAKKTDPTIMFFHGNGEIAADYDEIASLYTDRNINFFVADYRGYGFSNGVPTIAGLMSDAKIVFTQVKRWLADRGYTGRMIVMGRSLGSLCATEIAKAHQNEFDGLIIESGSASNFRNYLDMCGIISFSDPVWGKAKGFFNKDKVSSVTIPTLIIHAEDDSLIPLDEAKTLYEHSGSSSKKLVIIPEADHNDLMFRDMELYFGSITEFVEGIGK